MVKKLLAVIVSALLIISVVPFVPFTTFAETEGIFTYSVSDGKATITGLVDKNTAGAIEIPSTIGGYPVTEIGYEAFSYCEGLTSIVIPDSVTSIGNGAFRGCTGLISITIPDSVTSIGSGAFYGCKGLTSITIPDSVTSIGNGAFNGCSGLESIAVDSGNKYYHSAGNCLIKTASKTLIKGCNNSVIPNDGSVTLIGEYAFQYCSGLTSITIPDSVIEIGWEAFCDCTGLTSITLPNSVTSIGYEAFYSCTGLTSITLPNSVTSIGGCAFYGCTGLTSITLPNSVTSIGYRAFDGCTGLTSIVIPDSVTSIGNGAFRGCTGLESIVVDSGNKYYHSAGNCLIETASKTLIKGCNNSVIPNDGSVTSIGYSAFSNCSGLTSITLTNSVTSIGYEAFSYCSGLTSITIPDSVTSIGYRAFYGCTGLESIAVDSGNKYYHSAGNCLIETASKTLIKGCNNSVIPNDGSVTLIGSGAFYGCKGLTSITLPNSVTSIGGYAFFGCTGLTSITLPNSVTYIGNSAFDGCSGLTSITIPDSVTSIGDYAFYGCTGLTSIVIPDSVTSIDNDAFGHCTGLTSITIPNSVTSIGYYAFDGCKGLTDVYYTGTEEQKAQITIYGDNEDLLNATWHYNCNPDNPTCEHTETNIKNAKKATCTENGYTGNICCKNCEWKLSAGEIIPALGHSGVWKTITKATLTEKGLRQEICSRCGEILNEQEIPALGVTYSIDTAKENTKENISVAQSAGSNLPETVEVKAEKTNADDKQVTYEIRLEDNGEVIQPEAPVLVKLPIPAGFDKNKLNIYRTEPDGRKTRLDFIIDGDYAYFETEHFSVYEIIEKLCGDVSGDGSLNNGDLVTLFQYLSGWGNSVNKIAVDINGDGKENNQDLVLLFQFLSGWEVEIF